MSKKQFVWAANHVAASVDECRTCIPGGMDLSGLIFKNFMTKGFLYEVIENKGESVVRAALEAYLLIVDANKQDPFVLQGLCLKAKSQMEISDCLTAELFADYGEIERATFSAIYQMVLRERVDEMLASGKSKSELLLEPLAENDSIRSGLVKRVQHKLAKVNSDNPMLHRMFGI